MRIDEELAQHAPVQDSVLTIGVFDGVHRGHRRLFQQLIQEAKARECRAGVVTFRNHPASVLRPDFVPRYLTTPDDRIHLISQIGVDFVIPVTFDRELSELCARDFVAKLQKRLGMRGLVVGPDFAMGRHRQGDVKALGLLGQEMGFSLSVVELALDGDQAVRSTSIRQAVAEGDVARAAALLGRHFSLPGVVVRGEGRGRTLGFPTINLEAPPEMATPGDGIYATWARVGERCYMAATSIGTRPTFSQTARTIEAFILDFQGGLYGRQVRLEFVHRLRDEIKYATVEALLKQIDKDVEQTRAALRTRRPNAL